MVKGYVRGGVCRPLFLFHSVVFFLFFTGGEFREEESGTGGRTLRVLKCINKTPVVQGSGLSLLGRARTLDGRGFLFPLFSYPDHAFG